MGLLDMVTGLLKQGDTKGENPLMNIVAQMISNPDSNGLQGLIKSFQENGLGEHIASWVSTGENVSISDEHIKNVFGDDQLGQISSQLGVSENEAAGGLAEMLPKVIDQLTPDGQMPEGDLLAQGLDLLKGKLFS
ncbi:MAG: DUF937 domain-containing protein [bacterium]|nr:DUF937 domain-containing protein [bacterium]